VGSSFDGKSMVFWEKPNIEMTPTIGVFHLNMQGREEVRTQALPEQGTG